MLQGVAELVEEGLHLPEGHQRGSIPDGRALVAHHVGHREADLRALWGQDLAPAHDLVHPRAAALLLWPGVRIVVEVRLWLSVLGDLEEPDVLVPDWRHAVRGLHLDAEELVHQVEEPLHHLREGEVGPEDLVVHVELGLTHPLSPKVHVPVLELIVKPVLLGEGLDLLHVLLGRVVARHPELLKKLVRLVQRCHLSGQRDVRVALVAQQIGLLLPELKNPGDDGGVVDLTLARPGQVSLVGLLPERAVLGVQHDGQVRRDVQGEDPRPLLRGGSLVSL
mmetsp:Transcript_2868/g.9887  ORF Transcript_2868/g.9887 Transcript_2868/m.9887 type:complete len:279 (-) Transcript_2868:980-1816(-)